MRLLRTILSKKRLFAVILIILVAAGIGIWRKGGVEQIIPSKVENESKDMTFVHATKQFALTLPEKWTVVEPVGGKQTFIYPAGVQVDAKNLQSLLSQDVIIIETTTNNKESYEALIGELKTQAEKNGGTVTLENSEYDSLRATKMAVKGTKIEYQQIIFNTPTVLMFTSRIDQPIAQDVAKSVTLDLTQYAEQVAKASTLFRDTKQNITGSKFSDIYKLASENLRKNKTEEDIVATLKDIAPEFNKNVLVWGVYINSQGLGTAINIVDQDKIIRRGSLFYAKENDKYALDGLKLSSKINYNKTKTEAATPTTKTSETKK